MIRLVFLSGASALLSCFTAAYAEDAASPRILETITVDGLLPVELGAETGAVTLLGPDELAIRLSPNPADTLRAVPGVAVSRSGGPGALTQVRMRGAEANHTLVLFDGIEVSDPVNGETDFGLLTALPAGRIEVLRGPASSLYGSDAIGGVVSIRSSEETGLRASAEAGSFRTARGDLSYAVPGAGLVLSGFTTGGVDISGTGGAKDGSDALSGLVRAGGDVLPGWRATGLLLARRSRAEFDTDTDFDGRLNDVDRETEATQVLLGGALSGEIGSVRHALRASFNRVERENLADGARTDEALGERTKLSWSPSIGFGNQTITGLAEFERETYERQDIQFGGFTNAEEAFESLGVAAEYRARFGALDLAASARHDNNRGLFRDATTWRLGAGYGFDSMGGRLRASAGRGIKNPTFTELFGFFPGSFTGNRDLKPERATSWEIGWDQRVGKADLSVTYFKADLQDEIFTSFNPDFTATALNRQGDSERSGVEIGLRWLLSDSLTVSGQSSYVRSQDDTGAREIRRPQNTASLALDWQPSAGGFRLGLAADYVGRQSDLDFSAFPARTVNLGAYTLVSSTLDYPVTEKISLTFRAENILDEAATDVFGYRNPGRGLFAGVRLR